MSKALNFIIFSNVKGDIIVNNKVKTFNKASSSLDLVVILLYSYFNKLDWKKSELELIEVVFKDSIINISLTNITTTNNNN